MNANAELLARLQAEGRAPKVGDVVMMGIPGRSGEGVTVESVRVVRKNDYAAVLYIEAGGHTFKSQSILGWRAWSGGPKYSLELAPTLEQLGASLAALGLEDTK